MITTQAEIVTDAVSESERLRLALQAAIKDGPHGPTCKTWNIVEWMRESDIFDDCDCWKRAAREAATPPPLTTKE